MKHLHVLAAVILVTIIGGAYFYFLKGVDEVQENTSSRIERPYDPNVSEEAVDLYTNATTLFSYVMKFGPKKTTLRLNQLSLTQGSCHDAAHKAGRFAYEIYEDRAFQECSAECHSGCYHGATEAYFKEHGTQNLSQHLSILCASALNPFFSHQCIHGIGHGLMAWTNYEIFDALKSCDLLKERQDSCWTGVFMENIVGGLAKDDGHISKYLNENPQYPCTIVDEKYKSNCYFLQTSRMMQLFGGDFRKIANACLEAPTLYQRTCFESIGRDVGGVNRENPDGAIAACSYAPRGDLRIGCLVGAAQDTFWDPTGKEKAIKFCRLLSDPQEKASCYDTIILRAVDVLAGSEERQSFCERLESNYVQMCKSVLR